MARKPLRCRFGFHRWTPQHDEHGQRCVGCVRCHKLTEPNESYPPPPGPTFLAGN